MPGNLHLVDADQLSWWLCERQLPSGGLNGRPEKLPDVCYSWWVLSALTILGRLHWVDKEQLVCISSKKLKNAKNTNIILKMDEVNQILLQH